MYADISAVVAGHCAQFRTYTTIEQDSRDIVHIVSVDKRETNRNSVIMEKECFIRWDCKKSEIQVWIKDIVNHFWYCSKHAVTEEQFKMMWVGVLHHVRDEHSWATGCCQHEPLEEGSQEKPWIKQGSAAHKALAGVVLDKRWLGLVKKFLNFRTTSDLESFQNHLLMYSSKRHAYTPFVYKTRTLLAAIDYNKHNRRLPARNLDGQKIYRRSYNKKSKSWSVYTMKEKKQYSYIPDLQRAILARRLGSVKGLPRKQNLRPADPRRLGLLALEQPPPTAELVSRHVSRGDLGNRDTEDLED
ncbi:uncharacterized protein V3H82_021887 [Fundulus diaphanus]